MKIRAATADDATEICILLRRSISELCHADHLDDPRILAEWLENKTPDNVSRWIGRPDCRLLVALDGDRIAAAAAMTDKGEIILNYVLPEARFSGFSKALLRALEGEATRTGLKRCTLTSTATAEGFYRAAGYGDDGASNSKFGQNFVRLSRTLAVPDMTGVP